VRIAQLCGGARLVSLSQGQARCTRCSRLLSKQKSWNEKDSKRAKKLANSQTKISEQVLLKRATFLVIVSKIANMATLIS